MSEYIDRDAMLKQIERREPMLVGDKRISIDALKQFVLNRPTADVAPVIRCRDCGLSSRLGEHDERRKLFQSGVLNCRCGRGCNVDSCGQPWADGVSLVTPEDFCSDGVKNDDV